MHSYRHRVEIFRLYRILFRYKISKGFERTQFQLNKTRKKFPFFPLENNYNARTREKNSNLLSSLFSYPRANSTATADQPFQPLDGIPKATATQYVSLRLQHAWPRVSPNYQTRAWTRFEARKVQVRHYVHSRSRTMVAPSFLAALFERRRCGTVTRNFLSRYKIRGFLRYTIPLWTINLILEHRSFPFNHPIYFINK